jgi:tetratricopeptide (TPR) repeat protein
VGFEREIVKIGSLDRATFYADREPVFFRRADTRYLHYMSAWALVHYLQNGPDERRARFRSFMRATAAGAPAATAWATTVGQVPLETMEREYRAYLTAWSWDRFVYPLPKLDVAPVEGVRALSDAETAIQWARLLGEKETKALAATALQEAIAHEPSSPEVAYRAGSDALLRGRPHEARLHFERALARDPNEPRALFGFVLARVTEAAGRPLSNEARAATLDALARLEKSAKTADQLDLVARTLLSEPTLDGALRAAERAVALDPGYFDALATRAEVHFARGEGAKAVADQERAIAILPERVDAQKYLARLETYRAASAPRRVSAGP